MLTASDLTFRGVFLTLVIGLSALTFGSFLIVVDPYNLFFEMKLRFTEGSETFEMWRAPPVELFIKVYLFNITNRDEFLRGEHETLRFEQVGPYVYRENITHGNVTFNTNGTVSAIPLHPLKWVPELSNGTEEDLLIVPNIALLSFAHLMSSSSFFTRLGVNLLIKQTDSHPLVTMTAWEFMFGYNSPLLSVGNKFMPSWLKFDRLGLVDRMYDFKGDTITAFTGASDLKLSGLLDNYNNFPYLPQWDAPCSRLTHASDGTKFPSLIKPNETLLFFRKSLCRSMTLIKVGEESVGGIRGYSYNFMNNSLDNGEIIKENKCFCRKGHCLRNGLIDVTDCYYGFPIALSYPHFLHSDPHLITQVDGMKPDPSKHTTYFIVNPESGLPLKLSVKIQINLALGNLQSMTNCGKLSNIVIPMLWSDIGMDGLLPNAMTKFFIYLNVAPISVTILIYLCLIGGVACIIVSIAITFCVPRDFKLRDPSTVWRDQALQKEVFSPQKIKAKEGNSSNNSNNSKEMEVYYCSLLSPTEKVEELEELEKLRVVV
ncbi:scavenger receptor class B member 1-like isoform X2 [Lycorma delicatula]|uniref:scavenger receptor class B member 1-like isoform X2 n=1 Tax=Lycorma delicatula TaxID=130591 RepID=UPI003F517A21